MNESFNVPPLPEEDAAKAAAQAAEVDGLHDRLDLTDEQRRTEIAELESLAQQSQPLKMPEELDQYSELDAKVASNGSRRVYGVDADTGKKTQLKGDDVLNAYGYSVQERKDYNNNYAKENNPVDLTPENTDQDATGNVENILDKGYEKIGNAVNDRINELTVGGMSESEASAQAVDEFWGSKPVDSETKKESPGDNLDGDGDGGLRPVEPRDPKRAIEENPGVLDPEDDESVGPAAIASIAQEPWTFDTETETEPPTPPPTPPPGPPTPPPTPPPGPPTPPPTPPPGPPTPPPAPPNPPSPEDAPIRIGIANLDKTLEAVTTDASKQEISRLTNQGGIKGFLRKILHGGIARPFTEKRAKLASKREILATGNVHLPYGGSDVDMRQTIESTMDKLFHDDVDQLISAGAGETHRRIEDQSDPEAQVIRSAITGLVRSYAVGDLDDDNFQEERNRLLSELAQDNPDLMGEGQLFADNLLTVAQNVRSMIRHDRGVDDILENVVIDLGQIRTDARTEVKLDRVDRVIERLQKSTIGKFVSESTIVTATSLLACFASRGTSAAASKVAVVVIPVAGSIAAGGMAGLRHNKIVKEERRQHARDMAMGETMTPGAKRRARMEEARYDTISATQATEALNTLFGDPLEGGLRELEDLSEREFLESLGFVSELRVRDQLSGDEEIDLFHYDSAESIADDRLQLTLSRVYAQASLRRKLEANGGIDWLKRAGVVGDEIDSFEQLLSLTDTTAETLIRQDISEKDRNFSRLKSKEVAMASATAAIVGFGVGQLIQEGLAHAPIIGDNIYGLGEGKALPGGRNTLLGGVFNSEPKGFNGSVIDLGGNSRFAEHAGIAPKQDSAGNWYLEQAGNGKKISLDLDSNGMLTSQAKDHLTDAGFGIKRIDDTLQLSGKTTATQLGYNKVTLPEEFKLHQLAPGKWEVLNPDGSKAQDLTLNFDGSFDDQTLTSLKTNGIGFVESPSVITETATVNGRTPIDIINQHQNLVTNIKRLLWYNNDTLKFDLNELRAHSGGINGTWFDKDGNVVLDITKMKENWSFHGNQSVNPFTATGEGRMSLGISMSKSTQRQIFDFGFSTTPDGRTIATIPSSNPAHQLFQMQGNERVFKGGFVEVLEHSGATPDGREGVKVLATLPGTNNPGNLTDQITTTRTVYSTVLDPKPPTQISELITYNGEDLYAPAPVIPYYARRGLEPNSPKPIVESIPGMYYGGASLEVMREWIRQNPNVLHPRRYDNGQWVEDDGSPVERSVDRERQQLQIYLDHLQSASPEYHQQLETLAGSPTMSAMSDDTRVSVNIPAWMEGGNIYNLLQEYINQTDRDGNPLPLDQFEINVIVNRKTGSTPDNTVAEIERFKADYQKKNSRLPNINYVDIELDPPNNNVGNARKYMTDLTLLRSLKRSGQSKPLYIESEDADLLQVDDRTIINIINKMDANPHLDALRGVQDRTPEIMKNNDYLFTWRRMWDFTETLVRSKPYRDPSDPNWNYTWNRVITGGWNTAYSAEAYAMIGGYDKVTKGEDMLIGEKITMARGDGSLPELEVVGKVGSRSDSSPRRFVHEILTGRGAYSDAFEDEAVNKSIREASLPELMDKIKGVSRIDSSNSGSFAGLLSGHYQSIQQMTPSPDEARAVASRMLVFLGFKEGDYEFVDGNKELKIKSFDNLKKALDNYRLRTGVVGATP